VPDPDLPVLRVSLDDVAVEENTPAARRAAVNVPDWTRGLTLASFPHEALRGDVAGWVEDICAGAEHTPPGLLLYGDAGSGKTGLSCAALLELAERGFGKMWEWNMATITPVHDSGDTPDPTPCWFLQWSEFLQSQRRTDLNKPSWMDLRNEHVSALLLDDIDVEAGTPFRETETLSQLEWSRYKRGRALIVTCNIGPERWEEMLGARIDRRLRDPDRFHAVHVTAAR